MTMTGLIRQLVREYILLEKGHGKPGGGLTKAGALKKINPTRFETEVRAAMSGESGDVGNAADELGVSKRRMYDYLNLPGLDDIPTAHDIEKEKEEEEPSKK